MNPDCFKLTLEQQFAFQRMAQEVSEMNPEQVRELLLQASRLLFLKDNCIKQLVREAAAKDIPSPPS